MTKRTLYSGLFTALLLVTALLGDFGQTALATKADTKLGDYSEAPYRDVVKITRDEEYGFVTVEIPAEYIFDSEMLNRTVTINGQGWPGIAIVRRTGLRNDSGKGFHFGYEVLDMFEQGGPWVDRFLDDLNTKWHESVPVEAQNRMIRESYEWLAYRAVVDMTSLNAFYPDSEAIVSINGQPWQETKWRDAIIDQTRRSLTTGRDKLARFPILWDVFLDPANNGHAREAYEARKPAPIALPPGTTVADQVVLTLGSTQVLHYRSGVVEAVTLDTSVSAVDGVTMIPLRGILDALGASSLFWEDQVSITGRTDQVIMVPGELVVSIVPLQQDPGVSRYVTTMAPRAAEIRDGLILVPLRAVAEALGYKITWNGATSQIIVSR